MNRVLGVFETWQDRIVILKLLPLIIDKAYISLYSQHNSVSFDRIILKLAEVDMDEVLDEFENRPDQIIYFRVTS